MKGTTTLNGIVKDAGQNWFVKMVDGHDFGNYVTCFEGRFIDQSGEQYLLSISDAHANWYKSIGTDKFGWTATLNPNR